jgi:hypothetical protein
MKGKNLLYLAIIVVVAISGIILSEKMSNQKPSEKSLDFFPGLSTRNISSIFIMNASDTIQVHRKGDIWVVSPASSQLIGKTGDVSKPVLGQETQNATSGREYPVDSGSIATALDKIVSMKKDVLISENPSKQALFEVDSSKGTFVEIRDVNGNIAGTVLIGKSGPDYNSNYVRMYKSNSVYNVLGSVGYALFSDEKRWRDKSIIKFDKASAKNIVLTKKDGTTISITKADSGNSWKILSPVTDTAKADKVDEILSAMSTLNASDFEDSLVSDSSMGLSQPEISVVVSLGNQNMKKLSIGVKKGTSSNYYVKTEGKDATFLVSENDINRINKTVDDLRGIQPKPVVPPKKKK